MARGIYSDRQGCKERDEVRRMDGLQPDERLEPRKARKETEVTQAPPVPAEDLIEPWNRPGLDPALRAQLRGPFMLQLQRENDRRLVGNPAWAEDPAGAACLIADMLNNGWTWVAGRGPGARRT
jgi:hypothetical protein